MSEQVIIEAGQKIRVAGQTYRAGENAELNASLEPVKMQKNRHLALECSNADCREAQRATGRVITVRTTERPQAKFMASFPQAGDTHPDIAIKCKVCESSYQWREVSSADNDQE